MSFNLRIIKNRYARWVIYPLILVAIYPLISQALNLLRSDNGFVLEWALIPVDEILHGGPPRDGIPSIDHPRFLAAEDVDFLQDSDRVLGIERNGIRKAYPIRILNHHEIVNDHFGDEAIVVSFCPLCGTGMAFSATVGGKERTFGVSGLLYKSDVLLYDRQSESLWSQLKRLAISGSMKGERLQQVAMSHTTWGAWKAGGDTQLLSTDTGYRRDYSKNPYGDYGESEKIFFPVGTIDRRYHPKEQVIGLELDGKFKAYPFIELANSESPLNDTLAGQKISVRFDAARRSGAVYDSVGREIPTVIAFWFAWSSFHPEGELFSISGN
ncbi:MAG: DUF3179 domain-containing protein [Gammaproteobacteria bacterium]|nr:DUF3179 domain-containing protein [Gammaproteobacteria bacterium]